MNDRRRDDFFGSTPEALGCWQEHAAGIAIGSGLVVSLTCRLSAFSTYHGPQRSASRTARSRCCRNNVGSFFCRRGSEPNRKIVIQMWEVNTALRELGIDRVDLIKIDTEKPR